MDQSSPSVFRLLEVYRAASAFVDIDSSDFLGHDKLSELEAAVSLAQQDREVQLMADADVIQALGRLNTRIRAGLTADLPSDRLSAAKRALRSFGLEVKATEVPWAIQYEIWDKDLCLYHSLDLNQFMVYVKKTQSRLLR